MFDRRCKFHRNATAEGDYLDRGRTFFPQSMFVREVRHLARASFILAAVLYAIFGVPRTEAAQDMSLSPIIEMQGDTIVACGALVRFGPSQTDIALALRKTNDRPRLTLSARLHGERLNGMDVSTASIDGADIFGGVAALPDGSIERVAEPNSDKATEFLREYFVSGADFRLKTHEGKSVSLQLAGPAPNSVRAAYLSCAGDFFR